MQILKNSNLSSFLSFKNSVQCNQIVEIEESQDIPAALKSFPDAYTLGGGSNILIADTNINKSFLLINTKGIRVVKENEDYSLIEVQAGEIWHDLVLWSLENNLGGLENLSLIPGKVGAAPIQNIGAYGVELKDVLHSVNYYDKVKNVLKVLHKSECQFGYRESIFKHELKGQVIITSVILKLTKQNHQIHTDYGAIKNWLEEHEIRHPGPKDISLAVVSIRNSKLPDPNEIGNAGSFFKM